MAEVVNNVIGQSEHTENRTLLAFGAEGSDGRPHALTLTHNTFINFGQRGAVFVQVFEDRLHAAVERRWINNLCVGAGQADALLTDASQGNFAVPLAALQGAQEGRYALTAASGLQGRGIALTAGGSDQRRPSPGADSGA